MEINEITVLGGIDKSGINEKVGKVVFKMGDIVSIVGPTGCGKTTLINDIELCADVDTPSQRTIFFNDASKSKAPERVEHSQNPVALITQHTNFLSDLPVKEFLETHARVRHIDNPLIVEEVCDFANQLTGEPLIKNSAMTELSGGQTRALLIADAVIIGNAPIILLDEIENAGIHRTKALELLKKYKKIFIFVTHDPRIAMFSDFRLVMRNGGMSKVIVRDEEEQCVFEEIVKLDDLLFDIRKRIRDGEKLKTSDLTVS